MIDNFLKKKGQVFVGPISFIPLGNFYYKYPLFFFFGNGQSFFFQKKFTCLMMGL